MRTKVFTILFALLAYSTLIFAATTIEIIDGIVYELDYTHRTAEVLPPWRMSGAASYTGDIVIPSLVSSSSSTTKYTVNSIGEKAFQNCSITSISLPFLMKIKNQAFQGSRNLTSITIPGVATLGTYVFDSMDSLKSVIIGGTNLANIPSHTFSNCPNLKTVSLPYSIKTISEYAFLKSGIVSIEIPSSVTTIEKSTFFECDSLTTVTFSDCITTIGETAFSGCDALTSIVIPDNVTWIKTKAFSNCAKLSSVTIGKNVSLIGDGVFAYCTALKTVVWNVKSSNNFTFDNGPFFLYDKTSSQHVFKGDIRSNITSVVFGKNVEKIPDYLCYRLTNVRTITIPASVTEIGTGFFNECTNITTAICERSVPPILAGESFSFRTNSFNTIYVPCGTDNAYKSATYWSDHASKIKYAPLPYIISTNAQYGVVYTDANTKTICNPCVSFTAEPADGYHFVQWNDSLTDNPRQICLVQDTTIGAIFAINVYEVKFFGFEQELLDCQSIEHGSSAVAPEVPLIDGYEFLGWDKSFTRVTSNLDIYAQFERTEDIDIVDDNICPHKTIYNGQIRIIRGNKAYTILGTEL